MRRDRRGAGRRGPSEAVEIAERSGERTGAAGRAGFRRHARGLAVGLVVSVAVAPAAFGRPGEEPLVTDRPDFTESAVAVAPGRVQLEAGATFTDAGEADEWSVGEILLRVGLVERLELRLGAGSLVDVDGPGGGGSGWADPSFGLKLELPAAPAGGEAALLLTAGLPSPSEVGGDGVVPSAVVAGGWDLSPGLSLGANLGYAYAREAGERFDQLFASAALGVAAAERLGLFAELYAFSREEPGGDDRTYADAGLTWLLSPDLQLDLRIGRGLEGGEDSDRFAGAGLVVRW